MEQNEKFPGEADIAKEVEQQMAAIPGPSVAIIPDGQYDTAEKLSNAVAQALSQPTIEGQPSITIIPNDAGQAGTRHDSDKSIEPTPPVAPPQEPESYALKVNDGGAIEARVIPGAEETSAAAPDRDYLIECVRCGDSSALDAALVAFDLDAKHVASHRELPGGGVRLITAGGIKLEWPRDHDRVLNDTEKDGQVRSTAHVKNTLRRGK